MLCTRAVGAAARQRLAGGYMSTRMYKHIRSFFCACASPSARESSFLGVLCVGVKIDRQSDGK